MSQYPHIMARVFNKPLLVTEDFLSHVVQFLRTKSSTTIIAPPTDAKEITFTNPNALVESHYTSYYPLDRRTLHGEVAMVSVMGALAQRQGFDMDACATIQGYDRLRLDMEAAASDDRVKGVLLNIDSPGGEVAGNSAFVDYVANYDKPVWALANEHAYSAAMGIASAADRFMIPASGGAGSIGVVMAHASFEKALDMAGIDVTYIYAGDHKVDGNPTQALPDDVRADFQKEINRFYGDFTLMVANNRGIQQKDVIATQARCFSAEDAVKHGLADEVMSADDTLAAFREHIAAQGRSTHSGATMSNEAEGGKTVTTAEAGAAKAATDAPSDDALQAAKRTGIKEGASAEHTRVFGILECEEAKGKLNAASVYAKQGLSVEQAKAMLPTAVLDAPAVEATTADPEPDVLGDAMQASGSAESGVEAVQEGATDNAGKAKLSVVGEATQLLAEADGEAMKSYDDARSEAIAAGGAPNVG